MAESKEGAQRWLRLLVTVAAPFVVLLGGPLGLPGLSDEVRDAIANAGGGTASIEAHDVFSLGVMPWVSAALIVEFAAVIVPSWRRLRVAGPEGRAKLLRATVAIMILVASLQAAGVARHLAKYAEASSLPAPSLGVVVLALVAGTCLLGIVAEIVSRVGLGAGLGVMFVGIPLVQRGQRALVYGDVPHGKAGAVALACLVAIGALTWGVLRDRSAAETKGRALSVPTPSGNFGGVDVASLLVALAIPVSSLVETAASAAATLAAAVGLVFVFNRPSRVAAVAARAGAIDAADARGEVARAALITGLWTAIVFALVRAGRTEMRESLTSFVLLTAVAVDAARELTARGRHDLAPVWPEHRPYAIGAARFALDEAGIPSFVRGEGLRRILQFFGPYAPMTVFVPRADAARARDILARVLGPAEKDEAKVELAPWSAPKWALGAVAATLVALGAAIALPAVVGSAAAPEPDGKTADSAPRPPTHPEVVQFTSVDDAIDPFEDLDKTRLPRGVALLDDTVPRGELVAVVRFARRVRQTGETQEDAAKALLAFAATLKIPADDRFVFGDFSEENEEGKTEIVGVRTWLVKAKPELGGDAIATVGVVSKPGEHGPRASLALELTPAGGARFAEITAALVKQRLAILVRDKMLAAPRILQSITGGHMSISMGNSDYGQELAAARALEASIAGR